MKIIANSLFVFLTLFLVSVNAQICPDNFNFENGDKTNWNCKTGGFKYPDYDLPFDVCMNPNGINAPLLFQPQDPRGFHRSEDQHVITTGGGTDLNSNGNIPVVAPDGGTYSLRIGDGIGYSSEHPVWAKSHATAISYSFLVTKDNSNFTYMYSVFVCDAYNNNHDPDESARFDVYVTDGNGKEIECGAYSVNGADHTDLMKGRDMGNGTWWYSKWTKVSIDLSPNIGEVATIEFRVADCKLKAHGAYAYVDVLCGSGGINSAPVCANASTAQICAPDGYIAYDWLQLKKITGSISGSTTGKCVTINNPSEGEIYKVNLKTYSGCDASLIDTIKGLSVDAGDDLFFCPKITPNFQLNPIISANNGLTYSWTSLPLGFTSNEKNPTIITPSETTKYILTVTNQEGCKDTDELLVTIDNSCDVTVELTQGNICEGDCFDLLANIKGGKKPYTITWSANVLTASNAIGPFSVCPKNTTEYTVNVEDANGLKGSTSVTITVSPSPTIEIYSANDPTKALTTLTVCENETVKLLGKGADTYLWNPTNETTSEITISPLKSTTYSVKGISNLCESSAQLTVLVEESPTIGVNDAIICEGELASLNASGAVNYSWSPVTNLDNNNTASVLSNSIQDITYTITGTSPNGCTSQTQAKVTVNKAPIINTSDKQKVCKGEQLTLSASGGVSYLWEGLSIENSTLAEIKIKPIISSTYTVTAIGANNCEIQKNIEVEVVNATMTVSPIQSICKGESVVLEAKGTDFYTWSTLQNTAQITVNPLKNTIYQVEGKSIDDCKITASVLVEVHELPTIFAGKDIQLCKGEVTKLKVTGGEKYLWDNTTLLSDPSSDEPLAKPIQTIVFTVEGTNEYACKNTDQVKITVLTNPIPFVSIVGGNDVCDGDEVTFQVITRKNQGLNPLFEWFIVENSIEKSLSIPSDKTEITLSDLTGTEQIYVKMTSDLTCLSPLNAIVFSNKETPIIHLKPIPVLPKNINLCEGKDTTLQVKDYSFVNNISYEWYEKIANESELIGTGKQLSVEEKGIYQVKAINTDFPTCQNSSNLLSLQTTSIDFTLEAYQQQIKLGEELVLTAQSTQELTYTWKNTSNQKVFSGSTISDYPIETSTYEVIGKMNTCQASKTVEIEVLQPVIIPNAFSPNGDGKNETWIIKGLETYERAHIRVFNRWGDVVYEDYHYEKAWDGTYSENELPVATYYYLIELNDQEKTSLTGSVTIIK